MATLMKERVTEVHHWNDTLFSFKSTRDKGFRYKNGHFTMIGLAHEGRPLLRAYSIVVKITTFESR
jgi:ferredoxin--NADP+ reductase